MDDADLQFLVKSSKTSTRHRRTCAGKPRASTSSAALEGNDVQNEPNFRARKACSKRPRRAKGETLSNGLEFIGRHPTFGAGDALIAIKYHQPPKFAKVAALKIKRCHQRCADHADPRQIHLRLRQLSCGSTLVVVRSFTN